MTGKKTYDKQYSRLTWLLAAAVMIVMLPQMVFADSSYGFQPADDDTGGGNTMQMLVPSDITLLERTSEYYLNQINQPIDGTTDICFTFTMTAGMNNFNEEGFRKNNMPVIKIYDEDEANIVAEYDSGEGDLQFLGANITGEMNNYGTFKSTEVYIKVAEGVLPSGDYVLVFGRDLCGNNPAKILGRDVKFRFTVKGAFGVPSKSDLTAMLKQADEMTSANKDRISDTEPGYYPVSAWDDFQKAISSARSAENAGDDEKKKAAEKLYNAIKVFKTSVNWKINSISVKGIPDKVAAGDQGSVSAEVSTIPDDAGYKKVTWSAVTRADMDDPSKDEPAENLVIDEKSGKWTAVYSGDVWIKATSVKDGSITGYRKVSVVSASGVTAIALPDADTRVSQVMDKVLADSGQSEDRNTDLKVVTAGGGRISDEDVDYMASLSALKNLDLGNASLGKLKDSAFKGRTALEKVVLPEGLSVIGQHAFYNCSKLKSVVLPASLERIDGGAFAGCTSMDSVLELKSVSPPAYTTSGRTAGEAFTGKDGDEPSSVKTVRVPYSCREDYTGQPGWKKFTLEENKRNILKVRITEPGTLEASAENALKEKGLSESSVSDLVITSPEGVYLARNSDITKYLKTHFLAATTIDLSGTAFEDNKCNANTFRDRISLKHIRLPDSTVTVGGGCFYGCSNLRDLVLPSGLQSIGNGAFGECVRLSETVVAGMDAPTEMNGQIFPEQVTGIRIPPGSSEAYEAAAGWNSFRFLPMVEMTLSSDALVISTTQSGTLTASVTNYGSREYPVHWETDDESTVTVSSAVGKKMTVTGRKSGTANITATTARGDVTAICKVTVKKMDAPGSFKAASAAYNQIKVSWSGVSGAAGYEVFYSTSKSGSYTKKATLKSSARSYTFTGLTTGKTYYFKARGYKVESDSTRYAGDYTAVKSAKPALSKQSGFKVKAGKKSFTASWKKVSGASGYTVYYSAKKSSGFKSKTVKGNSKVKYTVKSLKKGKTYYVKSRAYRTVSGKKVYGSYTSLVKVKTK